MMKALSYTIQVMAVVLSIPPILLFLLANYIYKKVN